MPVDWAFLNEIGSYDEQVAFICCLQMVRNDGDIAGLISGAVNTGKSTYAITLAKSIKHYLKAYFKLDVTEFDYEKNVIYGQSKKGFDELLGDAQYNVVVIDEGYLTGLNLESTKDVTIYIGKVMNITRSKNNCILWCFQNMKRAARFLSERFNLWFHKPRKMFVILSARTNIFTTEDPWSVKKILKAESERAIKYYIKHNPNRVCYYKVPKLPTAEFNYYKKLKNAAHLEMKQNEESRAQMKQVKFSVLDELYSLIDGSKRGTLNIIDARDYLMDKYALSESEAKKYIKDYPNYASTKKVLKYRSEAIMNETE